MAGPKTKKKGVASPPLKALAHPLRAEILRRLELGRAASPIELSREIPEALSNVSYHMSVLVEHGAVELVRTEPRRGAIEHFYSTPVRPFYDNETWATLTAAEKAAVTTAITTGMINDIVNATEEGTIDSRLDRHLTRSPLTLDDQAWAELEAKLSEVLEFARELQGEVTNRIAAGETEGTPARLHLSLFEGAPARKQETSVS